MAFGGSGGRGARPDVILVDTTWGSVDYLAYQLARQGLRVHAFTPFVRRPRYLRVAYPYRSYVEQPLAPESSDAFRAMVDRVDPACIIPCTEPAVYWLWDQPAEIQRRCLPDVAEAARPLVLDRALLIEAAAGWGVPVPASMPLASQADCEAAIAGGLPLMVKSGQSIGANGVALCRTPQEVAAAFERFAGPGRSVTAQRFCTGPTFVACGLFVNGEAVHFYAGEMTVAQPPPSGYCFAVRSAGEQDLSEMLAYVESVCKQLEWTGVASFDFIVDQGRGFQFIDFNPRAIGSIGATPVSGVDLCGGLARWIRGGIRARRAGRGRASPIVCSRNTPSSRPG